MMSQVCEDIAIQNENLKLVRTLEEIYEEILDYLKKEFNIDDIEITLVDRDDNSEDILFKSNEVLDEESNFVFELIQSEHTEIKIIIKSFDNELMNKNKFVMNLALQAFSQTLYNKLLKDKLKDLTLIDNVTGLYNRHYLDNYADKILSLSNREHKKIAFVKVGIDQFKAVIDEFDYSVGDKVLKTLAKTLKDTVRNSDIVVKIDGDEFLVILPNTPQESALKKAEWIRKSYQLNLAKVLPDLRSNSISIGISTSPTNADNFEKLYHAADKALYEAKYEGRNCCVTAS